MIRDGWRLAVGTFSVVPVAAPAAVDRRRAAAAALLAPVAVLPLGLVAAVILALGHEAGLPAAVSALLAIGAVVLGNRALHLDGLSDTVDGLSASFDPARSLEVMRGGTAGPAGVVALVVVIGLQAGGAAGLLASPHPLRGVALAGLAICVSRAAVALACVRGVPAARPDGLGSVFAGSVPVASAAVLWLALGAALSATASWAELPWWRGAVAAGCAVVVVLVVVRIARRRLGGITGDVLGAAVELASAALLVALA